jgi:hypothetical protein
VGATTSNDTVFYPAKAAESNATFMDTTLVKAKRTGDTALGPRRILRQTISPAAAIMNPLDFWPNLFKILADAIGTKANYIGDGSRSFTAVSASTHGVARPNR